MDTKNQDWRQKVSFTSYHLDQKGHAVFTRQVDLFLFMDIQQVEALCSFQKSIFSLNNQTRVIVSHTGKTVKHGDIKCALNQGITIYCGPHEKGHLTTEFEVHFSENGPIPYKLSLLEKLPEDVEETDEMD